MERFIHIAAYLANITMMVFAAFIIRESYGAETYVALLLMVPPVLSLLALYHGPDKEERQLTRRLNKARMRKELEEIAPEETDQTKKDL